MIKKIIINTANTKETSIYFLGILVYRISIENIAPDAQMSDLRNSTNNEGLTAGRSFGYVLNEYHKDLLKNLKNSSMVEQVSVQPLFDYLKNIRRMRPLQEDLSFIDNL